MSPAREGVCYSWVLSRLPSPALPEAAQVTPRHRCNVCPSHPLQEARRDAVRGYAFPSVLPTLFSALNVRADEAASAAAETNAVSLPRRPPQFQRRAASLVFCPRLIALLLLVVKALSALSSEEAPFLCWAK